QSTDEFIIRDSKGNDFRLRPKAQSPTTTVLQIPNGVEPGNLTLYRYSNGKYSDRVNFHYYDLELSSPNTNLKSGEESYVQVGLMSLPDDGWIERPLPFPFRIDFRNLNPNTELVEGGNEQMLVFPNGSETHQTGSWMTRKSIKGVVPGVFSVNATLILDNQNFNDAFIPQEKALHTPQDFNNWISALKKDLQ